MMNTFQKQRQSNGWSYGYVEWIEKDTAYLSVVFSWQLPKAFMRASWHRAAGRKVRAGGSAIDLNPDMLANVARCGGQIPALIRHNPNATYTTRGCIRLCDFCAVPRIEGAFVELDEWEPRPIICDNNFLASSRKHFDNVIDRLKAAKIKNVDFNQGLDARLLKPYHAQRLAELDFKCIRLAWDHTRLERQFMQAFEILRDANIPASKIRVYVLIGWRDTPDDALYRLETVKKLGAWPNPMRYQPLDAIRKNSYVGGNWTDVELKRYMRYWSNLRVTSSIPFKEWGHRPTKINKNQLALGI